MTNDTTEDLRQEYLEEFREAMADEATDFTAEYGPGSMGCHEALHMASYFMQAIDNELMAHPAVMSRPDWFALASKAQDALFQLYQEIGAAHLPDEEPEPTDAE